ncbi:hypothetical protein CLOP_g6287 [Closterium sp. NIES-67]|nr:hypothetical protein CLOP_g6287 [Closterium sp. NIES-67]
MAELASIKARLEEALLSVEALPKARVLLWYLAGLDISPPLLRRSGLLSCIACLASLPNPSPVPMPQPHHTTCHASAAASSAAGASAAAAAPSQQYGQQAGGAECHNLVSIFMMAQFKWILIMVGVIVVHDAYSRGM